MFKWQDDDTLLQKKSYKALLSMCASDSPHHIAFVSQHHKDVQVK